MAEWLRGRLTEAEHVFAASIAGWQAAGQPTLTVWHRYQLGQVQRALGRLDAAIQTYEQALSAAAVPGRPPAPTVGLVYVGLAEVAYQRNELDSALRYVTEGIALERQFLPGTSPVAGLVLLAWIRQAAGDPAGALEAIGEVEHGSPATAGVLNPAPRNERGCCWPTVTWPRPRGGRRRPACALAMSRATRASRDTWCWPGCCWPSSGPPRRSRCWTGCTSRRSPSTGSAA